MAKNVKKRNWAFFVYPSKEYLDGIGCQYDGADGYGSAPENWRDILQQTGLTAAISPLHSQDLLEDGSGRTKKPHWHVIVCYSGPTSFNVVKELTSQFNSPIPQALEQVRGYFRYLTHMDNPEKYQYDEREIQTINGFNIADFTELTRSEITAYKRAIQKLVRELQITEYAELMDYLMDTEMNTEYEIASNHTYFFNSYITGRRNNPAKFAQNKAQEQQHEQHENTTENPPICCPECGSISIKKNGKTAADSQRWVCKDCGKSFI